ncbi:hypothetical protein JD844_033017 [Phrynosoma platyrhinos]|uniref:Nucleoside diphosphate kinase-like domain-containing protein n=1 Tax=Phrynosoma platyrhinos TaxID=52577 RepID=A0ABQ7T5Z6_PHRPL|nr:hypothetical protein JD844_033017 [Phrynosoma platyrhinos]
MKLDIEKLRPTNQTEIGFEPIPHLALRQHKEFQLFHKANDLPMRLSQKFLYYFSLFSSQSQDERFAFIAEWYDSNAALFRRYELLYYPKDGSVEMGRDLMIYILMLFSILLFFFLRTLALLKPDTALKLGEVIDIMINSGFTITKAKMMQLTRAEAIDFHVDHQAKPYYNELLEFITSGPVVALEILGDEAISRWKNLLGPANSVVARAEAPNSIRALFGTDGIRNVAHGSDSFASAARVSFFPSK